MTQSKEGTGNHGTGFEIIVITSKFVDDNVDILGNLS